MAFLGGLAAGLLGDIFGNKSAKDQQQQAQQAAQQQQQQAFAQQTAYIQQQEQAMRNALAGISSAGNPFLQAGGQVAKPNANNYAMPGGGGQVFGGGSGVPQMMSLQQRQSAYGLPPQGMQGPMNAGLSGQQQQPPMNMRPAPMPPQMQQPPFPPGRQFPGGGGGMMRML